MTLAEKLPTLDDAALIVLKANAERLERTGTPAQRSAAVQLIPSIMAELLARNAAKAKRSPALAGETKRPGRRRKAKPEMEGEARQPGLVGDGTA